MFSSTAYEAFYTYIGMYLHEASIKIITSQEVLIGLMMLILGCSFIIGAWRYFTKFMPRLFGRGRTVGISFFFKILACFLIGVSILKVDSEQRVSNYKRIPWKNNTYISTRLPGVKESYNVSFVFDLLVRSSEEISKYATEIVDHLFKKTNSELEAPSAFYRAILFAGSQTIDDPGLKDKIDVYAQSCFQKILPLLGRAKQQDKIDEFFKEQGLVDRDLELIPIETEEGAVITCLDLKTDLRTHLWAYAQEKGARFRKYYGGKVYFFDRDYVDNYQKNMIASSALVNHFLAKSEDAIGTQTGAKVDGTLSKFLLGWNRFWSFDGFMNLIGQGNQVGAALTAKRATQFSEYLQRAPHLKGMVKLFLIAVFPWLVFFVIAGRWKVIIGWFAIYTSVLLWTPIWTLLYHLMTSIAVSTELMAEFGKLSDGISLYASSFISAKVYQFYAIYSWLQLIVGPLPTLILSYGLFTSFLKDSESEMAPSIVTSTKDVGMAAATGGSSAAATKIISKV